MADLRSLSPISPMSRPSISMLPSDSSVSRMSVEIRDVFPAPVRPTIPILSLDPIWIDRFLRTSGSPSRYRKQTSLKVMAPRLGHVSAGFFSGTSCSASWSMSWEIYGHNNVKKCKSVTNNLSDPDQFQCLNLTIDYLELSNILQFWDNIM